MKILHINQLSKSYGKIKAVDHLDLQVNSGEILGLLGPNGSGKTTTLGMILGIIRPDHGSYSWFNSPEDPNIGRRLGALLETPNFYPNLSADENLAIVRHIKQSQENNFDALLELVGLAHRRHYPFNSYSLGMKQRLAIAATLVGDPEVLILDEPTNGLDPEGIADVRDIISKIAQGGRTVILASHILLEVEKICSHVAILKGGRLMATGPVGSIISDEQIVEIGAENPSTLRKILSELPGIKDVEVVDNWLEASLAHDLSIASLNKSLVDLGVRVTHLAHKKPKLEEEFLQIIRNSESS